MSQKEILLFSLLGLIAILLIVAIFLLVKRKNNSSDNSFKLLQNELFHLRKNFDEKLYYTNKIINDNLNKNINITSKISSEANKTIEEITKKISSIEQTNKQIEKIWEWLKWLENILQNPKQRWILWEYFLENILKNILPPENYKLQYKFKSWEVVDWVIFIDKKIIPIDSKFSLENYNNFLDAKRENKDFFAKRLRADLKNRIDETSKYIKEDEQTLDFAFMFIPSEALYYDLLVNKIWVNNDINLIEYAFKQKKVIIISPTTFYAYLQTVLQWLKNFKIEKEIWEIKNHIFKLQKHLNSYELFFEKLWNSLTTSINHYNKAKQEFQKIDKDILKIKN